MDKRLRFPVILLLAGLLMPMAAVAGEVDWLELLGSDVRTRKAAIIEEAMGLGPEEAELFRPIYLAYEREYERIYARRVKLVGQYSKNYSFMSEEKVQELVESWFLLQEDKLKIERKYYKKMQRALAPGIAARFTYLVHQLELLVSLQITAELPLIKTAE